MLGAATILALLFAMRGFALGVPVADDYAFLARLAFQHPLDPFDSMGATYYWRPVSRQIYFSLVGRGLIDSPGTAATLHLLILLGTYVLIYRIARRGFAPGPAAAIATLPLLSEAARALVTWPSGAQHLLAAFFAALTLHEAFAGRWLTAFPAGLAGVLSHESAFLALFAVPFTAWHRKPGTPQTSRLPPFLVVAGIVIVWSIGYFVARRHGVALPPQSEAQPFAKIPALIGLAVQATLNLEDLTRESGTILWSLHAALLVWALIQLRRPEVRKRLGPVGPALLIGLAMFLVGAPPLTWLLPDWNAWRAWIPSLALGLSLAVFYAAIAPGLVVAFAGFRLLAMMLALAGPPVVQDQAPRTVSHMSYPRIVRLQRIVESTRLELARVYPAIPSGAILRFWLMPRLASVGFGDSLAFQVWYGDRSVQWARAGGHDLFSAKTDALVEYYKNAPMPAVAIDPIKFQCFRRGANAVLAGRFAEAESLLLAGLRAGRRSPMHGIIADNLARVRLAQGNLAGAMAAADTARLYNVDGEEFWETRAMISMVRGDSADAWMSAVRSLRTDPGSQVARVILAQLQQAGFSP